MSRGWKTDRRGRSKGDAADGPFQKIPHHMSDSAAWRALQPASVKVLIDLRRFHNGNNNGDIRYALGIAAERLHLGKATVRRALAALVAHGFLKQVSRGGWLGRQAATWALTDKPHGNHPPTNEWKQWTPPAAGQSNASVPIRNPTGAVAIPEGGLRGAKPRRDATSEPVSPV